MAEILCAKCGAAIDSNANNCSYCGEPVGQSQQFQQQSAPFNAPPPASNLPLKNKVAAGVLGILLGGIGVHKFYMGKIGMGILYILFAWTGIPAIVGLIEGIIYLTMSDENFCSKYNVRLN